MKFTKFPEANAKIPAGKTGGDLHFYQAERGFVVLALELDKKDIDELKKTGRLWFLFGPAAFVPPPMQVSMVNPFRQVLTPAAGQTEMILDRNEQDITPTRPESTRDDKQPDKGDH